MLLVIAAVVSLNLMLAQTNVHYWRVNMHCRKNGRPTCGVCSFCMLLQFRDRFSAHKIAVGFNEVSKCFAIVGQPADFLLFFWQAHLVVWPRC